MVKIRHPDFSPGQIVHVRDGKLVVLQHVSCKEVKVCFFDPPYERSCTADALRKKEVRNYAKKFTYKDIRVGQIKKTKQSGEFEILEINAHNDVKIRFIKTGWETNVMACVARDATVKDPYYPSISGVGFIGEGSYDFTVHSQKAYQVWAAMLHRVYTPNNKQLVRSYGDVTVCKEWHNYQNFALWYNSQIEKFGDTDIRWNIDKDLLFPGNKVYCPETCCVIPSQINTVMLDVAFSRGDYPMGVKKHKQRPGFGARVYKFDKGCIWLGTYPTIAEAQLAYWEAKMQVIRDTALAYWQYLPEPLMLRLLGFNWSDAQQYYGEDAVIWHGR